MSPSPKSLHALFVLRVIPPEEKLTDIKVAQRIASGLPEYRLVGEVKPVIGQPGMLLALAVNGDPLFTFDGPACRFHLGHQMESPMNAMDFQVIR